MNHLNEAPTTRNEGREYWHAGRWRSVDKEPYEAPAPIPEPREWLGRKPCTDCGSTHFGSSLNADGTYTRHCHGHIGNMTDGYRPCLVSWHERDDELHNAEPESCLRASPTPLDARDAPPSSDVAPPGASGGGGDSLEKRVAELERKVRALSEMVRV